MKNLFVITEEDRKRILGLHESATKRQYLKEQEQYYRDAQGKVFYLPGPQNIPAGGTKITKQEYDTAMKTQAADPNTSTTNKLATGGNPKVKQIQKKLMDLGYSSLLGDKRDDGVLGPKTLDAVLTALSSSEKLGTRIEPKQDVVKSPTQDAELKPSAINQNQKTQVNSTTGGSGMGQNAANDAKFDQAIGTTNNTATANANTNTATTNTTTQAPVDTTKKTNTGGEETDNEIE